MVGGTGFSVFFKPILTEFGWSRAITVGAVSASRFEGGLGGPVVGWLFRRGGAMTSVVLHAVAYLTDVGIEPQAAANALGFMVLLSIPGRFLPTMFLMSPGAVISPL